jgi:hypothetical protein
MAKTVKIPTNMNPWKAIINGIPYVYPAGATVEVPDEVADLIEDITNIEEEQKPVAPPVAMGGADWNASEGEPGHVLNRTHWSETEESVWLPEAVFEFTEESEGAVMLGEKAITAGKTYKVTWNGVDYVCEAEYVATLGTVAFGNISYLDSSLEGYTEPFAAMVMDGQAMLVTFEPMPLSVTVSIVEIDETVHKIPDKFIDKDFRITATLNADMVSVTIDRTYEEILTAYRAGKNITILYKGHRDDKVYYFTEYTDGTFNFMLVEDSEINCILRVATIAADGSFSTRHAYLQFSESGN